MIIQIKLKENEFEELTKGLHLKAKNKMFYTIAKRMEQMLKNNPDEFYKIFATHFVEKLNQINK